MDVVDLMDFVDKVHYVHYVHYVHLVRRGNYMDKMRIYVAILTLVLISQVSMAQPSNLKKEEIGFRAVLGDTSFPAFNRILETGWGQEVMLHTLKQSLPYLEITQNTGTRYFGVARVPLFEYWKVSVKDNPDKAVLLAKVHLRLFLYDVVTQTPVMSETFPGYAALALAKLTKEDLLQPLKTAFQRSAVAAAPRIGRLNFITRTVGGHKEYNSYAEENFYNEDKALKEALNYFKLPELVRTLYVPNPLVEFRVTEPRHNQKLYLGLRAVPTRLVAKGYDAWGDEVVLVNRPQWQIQGEHVSPIFPTNAEFLPPQSGFFTVKATYPSPDSQPMEAKAITVQAIRLEKITMTPRDVSQQLPSANASTKEVVLAPGEILRFAIMGLDDEKRQLEMSDLQGELVWHVDNKDIAGITEDGILLARKAGQCIVKASAQSTPSVYEQANILVLPPVIMEIRDAQGRLVNDKEIGVATGDASALECKVTCADGNIDNDKIPVEWRIEPKEIGAASFNWDGRRLFFRAGSEETKIPLAIRAVIPNVPRTSQRKDSQAKVWISIKKPQIRVQINTPVQEGPYVVGRPIHLEVQGMTTEEKPWKDAQLEVDIVAGNAKLEKKSGDFYILVPNILGEIRLLAREKFTGEKSALTLVVKETALSLAKKQAFKEDDFVTQKNESLRVLYKVYKDWPETLSERSASYVANEFATAKVVFMQSPQPQGTRTVEGWLSSVEAQVLLPQETKQVDRTIQDYVLGKFPGKLGIYKTRDKEGRLHTTRIFATQDSAYGYAAVFQALNDEWTIYWPKFELTMKSFRVLHIPKAEDFVGKSNFGLAYKVHKEWKEQRDERIKAVTYRPAAEAEIAQIAFMVLGKGKEVTPDLDQWLSFLQSHFLDAYVREVQQQPNKFVSLPVQTCNLGALAGKLAAYRITLAEEPLYVQLFAGTCEKNSDVYALLCFAPQGEWETKYSELFKVQMDSLQISEGKKDEAVVVTPPPQPTTLPGFSSKTRSGLTYQVPQDWQESNDTSNDIQAWVYSAPAPALTALAVLTKKQSSGASLQLEGLEAAVRYTWFPGKWQMRSQKLKAASVGLKEKYSVGKLSGKLVAYQLTSQKDGKVHSARLFLAQDSDNLYAVVGVAPKDQWNDLWPNLEKSLNSLQITPGAVTDMPSAQEATTLPGISWKTIAEPAYQCNYEIPADWKAEPVGTVTPKKSSGDSQKTVKYGKDDEGSIVCSLAKGKFPTLGEAVTDMERKLFGDNSYKYKCFASRDLTIHGIEGKLCQYELEQYDLSQARLRKYYGETFCGVWEKKVLYTIHLQVNVAHLEEYWPIFQHTLHSLTIPDLDKYYIKCGVAVRKTAEDDESERKVEKIYEEADKYFSMALQANPHSVKAYYERGITAVKRKDLAKAEQDFKQAVSLDNKCSEGYYELACISAQQKEQAEAVSYVQRALEAGYKQVSKIRKDKRLRTLAQNPDFKRMLREAEKKMSRGEAEEENGEDSEE